MSLIPPWSDDYSVNNRHIDAQHKKLFELAAEAEALSQRSITKDEIKKILAGFFDYMKRHFADEEHYMESIGYPRLADHQQIHKEIVDKMIHLVTYNIRDAAELREGLQVIAKEWLLEHIMQEDMQIEKYLKEKEANKPAKEVEVEKIEIVEPKSEQSVPKSAPKPSEAYEAPNLHTHYIYGCQCDGKTHKVPYNFHVKIMRGASHFQCKRCKTNIYWLKREK